MNRYILLLVALFLLFQAQAQKITYSVPDKEDKRNMEFEILGKSDNNILIYKKNKHQHMICVYDLSMSLVANEVLEIIPEKVTKINFIKIKSGYLAIYQYEIDNIVYCDALQMNSRGKQSELPIRLDSTQIGNFSDNKIYSTSYSDDKSKILIYKRHIQNKELVLNTKLFNDQLQMIDSAQKTFSYNTYKDYLSEVLVDNAGNLLFAKEAKNRFSDNYHSIDIYMHKLGSDSLLIMPLPLENKYIEHVLIKVDNLNNNYIINSYYHEENSRNIDGLFTVLISTNKIEQPKIAFNTFSESFLNSIKNTDIDKYTIDKLIPKTILLKKNGSFVLLAENAYSETQNSNNQWNASPNMNFSLSNSNYYMNSPYNYSYGGYDNYSQFRTTRYSNNDILAVSIDSSLNLSWNNVIEKKQSDIDDQSYLSFSTMNSGSELFFLYIGNQNNKHIINNQSLMPGGDVKRYPAIKNMEEGYHFMPRLAKQIAGFQIVIPFLYRDQIGFAKLEF